jgi:hypothetical protein
LELKVEKKISKELYRPIDIMYQHGNSDNLVELTDWKSKIEKEDTLSDLFQY